MAVKPTPIDPVWTGRTVVILGGGPSLDLAQLRTVAMARLEGRCRVIAVNDAVYPAWWADWLHGCDAKWWGWHAARLGGFEGRKTTLSADAAAAHGLQLLEHTGLDGVDPDPACIRSGGNGGYQAIHCAAHAGAARIVLLGFDMAGGHWFGGHPDGIACDRASAMLPHFETLVAPLAHRGVQVLNATPGSALDCFARANLADTLPSAF